MNKQVPADSASVMPNTTAGILYNFSGFGKLAKDAEFVREVKLMFVKGVPKQVAQLWASIEEENWQVVAQQAHSLKANLGNLKMDAGAALLNQMESLAHQGDKKLLQASLMVVTETVEAVVETFKQELHSAV
jgi:HPt (histidine-containing phosphotransfer) domain-containing protein